MSWAEAILNSKEIKPANIVEFCLAEGIISRKVMLIYFYKFHRDRFGVTLNTFMGYAVPNQYC